MVLQIRPQGGGAPYAPARDLAYCWADICKDVARRLEANWFKPLHAWLDKAGVTDEELGEACRAHCQYLVSAHIEPDENIEAVLRRAGWFAVRPEAQIAYMFYLGQCTSGMFFGAIRDVLQLGDETLTPVRQLATYSRRARLVMSMPRWKRWLYFLFRPCRRRLRRKFRVPPSTRKNAP